MNWSVFEVLLTQTTVDGINPSLKNGNASVRALCNQLCLEELPAEGVERTDVDSVSDSGSDGLEGWGNIHFVFLCL